MANENYQNVNEQMQGQPAEQHEQQMDTNKAMPRNMMEALTYSMDSARGTLTRVFKHIRSNHPDFSTGSTLRRYHLAVLEAIRSRPLESFNIVFGLVGLAIIDSLTDEDKEALRNDSLD